MTKPRVNDTENDVNFFIKLYATIIYRCNKFNFLACFVFMFFIFVLKQVVWTCSSFLKSTHNHGISIPSVISIHRVAYLDPATIYVQSKTMKICVMALSDYNVLANVCQRMKN